MQMGRVASEHTGQRKSHLITSAMNEEIVGHTKQLLAAGVLHPAKAAWIRQRSASLEQRQAAVAVAQIFQDDSLEIAVGVIWKRSCSTWRTRSGGKSCRFSSAPSPRLTNFVRLNHLVRCSISLGQHLTCQTWRSCSYDPRNTSSSACARKYRRFWIAEQRYWTWLDARN